MDALNQRNQYITKEDVQKILKNVNITTEINDIKKYQKAFTHKSYVKDTTYSFLDDLLKLKNGIVDFQDECNERIEFYGDSVICSTTVEYLFLRYPMFDEGILTKFKTIIVSRDYLARFARFHGFQKYLLISNHMENIHGRDSDRILEDCFEAFIAAITMDLGYLTAKQFIIDTMEECVNFSELLFFNQNYKDRILNYFQKNGWSFPKYQIISQIGPPNKRTFIVSIYQELENKRKRHVCQGIGNTKKDAEQNASLNALKMYKQLHQHELKLISQQ